MTTDKKMVFRLEIIGKCQTGATNYQKLTLFSQQFAVLCKTQPKCTKSDKNPVDSVGKGGGILSDLI